MTFRHFMNVAMCVSMATPVSAAALSQVLSLSSKHSGKLVTLSHLTRSSALVNQNPFGASMSTGYNPILACALELKFELTRLLYFIL